MAICKLHYVLVVLNSDTDAGLISVTKEGRVTVEVLALDDLLSQVDQLVAIIRDHNIANCVVSLDFTDCLTV